MINKGNPNFLNILIVEDEPALREIYQIYLKGFPCHIEAAENGEKALELIRKREFDLMFTDMNMPIMNGLELVKNIRKENLLKDLKIYVISATASSFDPNNNEIHFLMQYTEGFIDKPTDEKALLGICNSMLKSTLDH
ncbi:MAG: response regulator [Bdellovibrionales bacterium]|nr:response regulator [Bdellovibrionales bacterium]NQZ19200.1 response regulator [Bdellovibrionales bacterium]